MPVGRAIFSATFPAGEKQCIWLDAYMGLLCVKGVGGFTTTRDMDDLFPGLECTDPVEVTAAEAAEFEK
jgi:hypothetical protein